MRCVRLAVEFPRAVPLEPVLASARLTRPGRKLALAEARLTTLDGTEVLRASATLLRRGDVELPASAAIPEPEPIPGPDDGRVDRWQRRRRDRRAFTSAPSSCASRAATGATGRRSAGFA